MMNRFFRAPWQMIFLIVLIGIMGHSTRPAAAASSAWSKTDFTAVRLIASGNTVGTGETVPLGLHFTLKKGWKVYWRSPGDAGFPPSIKWDGSENLATAEMFWPAPKRFQVLGLQTLGYTDEVVFPITATLKNAGESLSVTVALSYLACSEICIPFDTVLKLDLPQGAQTSSIEAQLINQFETRVPATGAHARGQGLTIERAEATGRGQQTHLLITARAEPAFIAPDVFIEGPDVLAYDPPEVRYRDGRGMAELSIPVYGIRDLAGTLVGAQLTLTLVDGARAIEIPVTVAAGAASADTGATLLTILALAVLGGLILNLMPCVLPVLSLKLLSAVSHGGAERRSVRLSFIASALGILFSFAILASALAGLKAAGLAIGWGIQFQQPWFLVAMTLVVVLFACNLWGFFEVRLPHAIADVGQHTSHVRGLGGHFLQGAFATLLATPCSAPFLGTAIGFALSRGMLEIYAVFFALGIGLALPFLLVAIFPAIATRLPRPGPWMVTMKRVLGYALAATAVWLISVLYAQVSPEATATVAILMGLAAAALYAGERLQGQMRHVGFALLIPIATMAFVIPALDISARTVDVAAERIKGIWGPFAPQDIPKLVAQGKIIFVDVTADWCITCQVNKALVLSKGDVYTRLSDGSVITMQADWTRPSDVIANYLAAFGRYGIPFNAVYGPGSPKGQVLPELLSADAVLEALEAAKTPALSAN